MNFTLSEDVFGITFIVYTGTPVCNSLNEMRNLVTLLAKLDKHQYGRRAGMVKTLIEAESWKSSPDQMTPYSVHYNV